MKMIKVKLNRHFVKKELIIVDKLKKTNVGKIFYRLKREIIQYYSIIKIK